MGYVYLLHEPSTNRYKIGVTSGSVQNRMKKLQTGNSSELQLFRFYQTDHPNKKKKMLHTYFRPQNVLNEWYDLSYQQVTDFIPLCESLNNTIKSLKDNPYFLKK